MTRPAALTLALAFIALLVGAHAYQFQGSPGVPLPGRSDGGSAYLLPPQRSN